ncbi:coiled-coil domain-containing protein [Pochonia chlamydosporia 170]|uniref:Coiled-coil domain-containing protein n=1 Tax=Pochonia chlamydosporia 170 TaxID=1380566 RepID=A0A179F957_METCM|nr:coiled-coil domain-containing protein [Pochonia chlamydosporia 170]OAQ61986.1 coiled-coil domain-containing protein [Pochonia chlamydosporia 170]
MSSSLNTLGAASEDRKARLAALRNLKRKKPDDDEEPAAPEPAADESASATPEADVSRLHLSGRNYDPETRGPRLGFDLAPNEGLDKPTLEELAADVESQARQQAAEEAQNDKGLDLFKLQPKKPNWDLKRGLESKMDILNVRTDNAIARLVRDRISGAQKAAAKSTAVDTAKLDGDAVGMDGVALVEGLRVREQEEEEEERRERAEDEALLA